MNKKIKISILPIVLLLVSLVMAQNPFPTPTDPAAREGSSFSAKSERNYTMNVSVEFIPLIHPSWNNVGGGRIAWIEEPGGDKGLELLIGSDPARTPRKINRWGFISERVSGSSAGLIGIMTQSDEQSVDQAKASALKSEKEHIFKAIRSRLNGDEAQSFTVPLQRTENFTYKDAALLLSQIPEEGPSVRQLKIPAGADPGFLFSVKEFIRESVDKYCSSGKLSDIAPRQYVYNASLFKLTLMKSKLVKKLVVNGKEYHKLIESEFEALNKTTGKKSGFSITYGTDAQISNIPVRITYKPRWWFQAELLLDEGAAGMAQTAQKVGNQ
jgi:hypothetical protein